MRITSRQLRQIIKEELTRASRLNEADLFTQADLDREEEEEFARAMAKTADPLAGIDLDDPEAPPEAAMKMPGAPPAVSKKGITSAAAAAGVSTDSIERIETRIDELTGNLDADAPGALDIGGIVFNATDPMTLAKLSQVVEGRRVLSRGARGKEVIIAQALLLGTLRDASDMVVGMRGAYEDDASYMKASREASTLGARGIVRKAMSGQYITFIELTELLVSVLGTNIGLEIDGVFGDATFHAVVAAQLCAKHLSTVGTEDAVIDGQIGRQTMSYLLGFKTIGISTNDRVMRYIASGVDPVTAREIPATGELARGKLTFDDLYENRRNRRRR